MSVDAPLWAYRQTWPLTKREFDGSYSVRLISPIKKPLRGFTIAKPSLYNSQRDRLI